MEAEKSNLILTDGQNTVQIEAQHA
jgi:hypothetical protein